MIYYILSIIVKNLLSLFYLLPILYSIASVSFATITQQIETDWLVVLANKDENWLRDTNSFLSQIDLGCKAAAPAVTGLLFAKFIYYILYKLCK
jgi:hypothetical protein